MKELITRVEELAIQAAGAQLQIDKSEAEARDLGRELGKARQKIMELVNERDHALARVPPEAWLEENKKLADRIERMEASEDIVRKSLNEEITNRDRELREMDAEAKAHREALQAKDAEISRLKETHAIICNAKPDESVIDFMSRMKDTNAQLKQQLAEADSAADKNGCHATEETAEFINRLASELKTAKIGIREKDAEIGKLISLSNERAQEISKLRGTHADDIARIDKLSAQLAEIEAEATECGRDEGETVPRFMSRMVIDLGDERASSMAMSKAWAESKEDVARERERGTRINSEYEASIANIMAAANKLGRADYESPEAFMNRQAADMESQARQLNLVRQELGDKTQKVIELSRWHEENLEKIKGLEAQLAHETARLKAAIRSDEIYAKECGRFDGESLRSFIGRIVGDNIHMRDELSAANQRMQIEKMKELEEVVAAVTADRDRIRTELAAILAEANKSGRCNGDPVQLLKQGQADLDALIRLETDKANLLGRMDNLETQLKAANAAALSAEEHAERATFSENESAKLNALVSKLQGELATARDQAGVAQHECSIWNNAATRAGQTLTKLGKLQDENEAQFIERMQGAEFNREEQLKNALAAKNKAQSEDDESHRRFMNLIRMADSCGRLRGESVEQFIARQDQLRVSNMEQRDEARGEVARLSALVAELQVELDDARGQYGGIMAQLGNETPLQLIERMQRLAQDQRASTIPHDERAMLVAASADLRKRLEESQKAHANTEHELRGKLRSALATVENQRAAIAEAKQAAEKYTAAVEAAAKLKDWASTVRHKVLVKIVHDKAMEEYDNIIKELDGEAAK